MVCQLTNRKGLWYWRFLMAPKDDPEAGQGTMFGEPSGDPFGDSEPPPTDDSAPEAAPDDWQPPSREEWNAEQARLQEAQASERRLNEARERDQARLMDLLARRQEPAAGPIEPPEMPDPTVEPEKFNTWIRQGLSAVDQRIDAAARGIETRVSQNQNVDQLFAEFVRLHPEYADKRWLVEAASIQAGVKPGEPKEKIFRETLAVLTAVEKAEPNRTGGVTAGGSGRRRRAAPKTDEDDDPQDLVDQIAQEQVRLGLH